MKKGRTYVALLDTVRFEDVGGLADFLKQLLVGNLDVLSGLISLPDDGNLSERKGQLVAEEKRKAREKWGRSGPCSGACRPIGRRSCTKRSARPRGTTGRLPPRTNRQKPSSRGGACVEERLREQGEKVSSPVLCAGEGREGSSVPVEVLLGHLQASIERSGEEVSLPSLGMGRGTFASCSASSSATAAWPLHAHTLLIPPCALPCSLSSFGGKERVLLISPTRDSLVLQRQQQLLELPLKLAVDADLPLHLSPQVLSHNELCSEQSSPPRSRK
jgi:hypothetical protein